MTERTALICMVAVAVAVVAGEYGSTTVGLLEGVRDALVSFNLK